jgi:hypothetical protein
LFVCVRVQALEVEQDKIQRLPVIDGDERLENASLAAGDEVSNLPPPLFGAWVEA